jgi:hypothetical protein
LNSELRREPAEGLWRRGWEGESVGIQAVHSQFGRFRFMGSLRHIKRPPRSRSVTGRNTMISVLLQLDQGDIAVKSRSGLLSLSCIDFRETMQIFSTTSFRRSGYHNTASPSFRTEEASVLLPRTSLRRRAMQMHNSHADRDCQAKRLFSEVCTSDVCTWCPG